MSRLLLLASMSAVAACGGSDDGGVGGADGGSGGPVASEPAATSASSGFEMVPLSSLDLGLPFELTTYDPPVPSDVAVDQVIENQKTDSTHAGLDIYFTTSATWDDIKDDYAAYMSTFELSNEFVDSQSWSGRLAEGGPGLTITMFGGRLNIAEIQDQG